MVKTAAAPACPAAELLGMQNNKKVIIDFIESSSYDVRLDRRFSSLTIQEQTPAVLGLSYVWIDLQNMIEAIDCFTTIVQVR
jgi:hypothetical protein